MLKKPLLLFLSIGIFSSPGQAEWSGRCLTTREIRELNPSTVKTPILYWKAKVEKAIGIAMIRLPESQELLVNLFECQKAAIREDKPQHDEEILIHEDDSASCKFLGDFWVPLADIDEVDSEASLSNFNLDHPTEYFSSRISTHLQDYADSMKWDPIISASMSSMDHVFLGLVGFSIWNLSTYHFVPNSFWSKMRRRGMQGIGIMLMIRQAYLAATSGRSQFVEERNERAAHIETLIRQINERMTMRLDGQDQGQNLEEADGYSALVNSITRANNDTYERFCND